MNESADGLCVFVFGYRFPAVRTADVELHLHPPTPQYGGYIINIYDDYTHLYH